MTYATIESLFTGICDAIRNKDGTTALIRHQDIPARITAISSGGSEGTFTSPFYTYNGGNMKIENMVASNFNAYSAIFLNEAFLPGDSTWEIGVKFTYPSTLGKHASVLFGSWNGFYYCPSLEIGSDRDLHKIVLLVPDGVMNTWNQVGSYTADIAGGTECYVKVKFDGTKYVVSLSSDGGDFEDIIQIDYGVMYQHATYSKLQFGGINRSSNHYFESSIDLKETYIKIGGEIWWGRGNRMEEIL